MADYRRNELVPATGLVNVIAGVDTNGVVRPIFITTDGTISVSLEGVTITAANLNVRLTNADDDVLVYGYDGAVNRKLLTDATGAIIVGASGLPVGAATEATLAALNAKVTAVNTGAVVITSGTITTVSTVTAVTAITNALPAGTNAIGKLAANSGVDIGDVDVLTVGGQAPTYGAGAVAAGTQRNTLASDDPAVVSLQIMDDWDESDRAKVNPIAGQAGVAGGAGAVGATVQRVTLASDDPAVALLGGTGSLKDAGTAFTVTRTLTLSADMTTTTAISPAPTGGQNLYILDIFFSTDTAMNNIWEEETSGTDLLKGFFVASNGIAQMTPRGEFKVPTADKKLFAKASAAGNVAHTVISRSA